MLSASISSAVSFPDLILCGDSASDWSSGIVGPSLAERLALPQITGAVHLAAIAEHGKVRLQVTRKLERGYRELVAARLPVLITVTGDLNEPRYPSLPAHVAALRASMPVQDPLPLLAATGYEEVEETTLLEMHTPQSQHSAFERIGEIIAGGPPAVRRAWSRAQMKNWPGRWSSSYRTMAFWKAETTPMLRAVPAGLSR